VGGRCAFHDLSAGETAAPDLSGECGGGKTPPQISRRKDQAGSLGTEEKRSRTRDIHSKAFTPGITPAVLCQFLIDYDYSPPCPEKKIHEPSQMIYRTALLSEITIGEISLHL